MGAFLADFREAWPWVYLAIAFGYGAIFGSFLNVVIIRWPRGDSLWKTSACPHCGTPIRWRDNVLVFGWLLLRGKARCCGAPISPRYPLVEALTGGLTAGVWWHHGGDPAVALCLSLFLFIGIAAAGIDWDTMVLPDGLTMGGAYVGVFCSFWVPALHMDRADLASLTWLQGSLWGMVWAVAGVALASGVLMWIAISWEILKGRAAMGFGDVKLLGTVGAFLGWQSALVSLFAGAVFTLGFLVLAGCRRNKSREGRLVKMPFGPGIVAGAVLVMLFPSVNPFI